jgi:hypothetical protein
MTSDLFPVNFGVGPASTGGSGHALFLDRAQGARENGIGDGWRGNAQIQ